MGAVPTIAERLRTRADSEETRAWQEFSRASDKFETLESIPETRSESDRVVAVLTPAVVETVGSSLIEGLSAHDAVTDDALLSQQQYAIAAILIASETDSLAGCANEWLDQLAQLAAGFCVKRAELVQYVARLYSETDAAERLFAATTARLAELPSTQGECWARALGLNLPLTNWQVAMMVPVVLEQGRSDTNVFADIDNVYQAHTSWSVRMGAGAPNVLGGSPDALASIRNRTGCYARDIRRGNTSVLQGEIAPVATVWELPRALADIELAHPEVTFDRMAASVTTTPPNLITRKRERHIVAWLHRRR